MQQTTTIGTAVLDMLNNALAAVVSCEDEQFGFTPTPEYIDALHEMRTSDGDLVAPASQVACLECPDSDVGFMTRVSDALRQYAEENDLEVIDVPLATVDDAVCIGMPEY